MKRNRISEATGSGSAGHFKIPIVLAPQDWKTDQLAPFNEPVYKYTNAELAYEEADGDFKETPEQRKRMENKTELLSKIDTYLKSFYTGQNDDEGSSISDIESPDKLIQQAVGPLKEDLAVWFGTKKKPKGSKQPKGPWVNICRKVDGKHPPCGRPEASDKGYPKCRAAGVASKMSDSEKRSACQQKRRAEKTHNKSGTGNSPKMVSYKPKNESMQKTIRLTESELIKLVKKVLTEESEQINFSDRIGKPRSYEIECGNIQKTDFPQMNNRFYCYRPLKYGSTPNRAIKRIVLTCDKIYGGATVALSDGLMFNCNKNDIVMSGPDSYDFIKKGEPGWEEKMEQQKQSDIKWFSNFCSNIKENKRHLNCKS